MSPGIKAFLYVVEQQNIAKHFHYKALIAVENMKIKRQWNNNAPLSEGEWRRGTSGTRRQKPDENSGELYKRGIGLLWKEWDETWKTSSDYADHHLRI